jgi:hypothetical protein
VPKCKREFDDEGDDADPPREGELECHMGWRCVDRTPLSVADGAALALSENPQGLGHQPMLE